MKLILLLLAERFLIYMDKKIKASDELTNQGHKNDNISD